MISTHTLTWSVTTAVLFHAVQLIISTHTLTWSVTGGLITLWFFGRFQLTRSRGAWQQTIICNDLKQHFNSHAHVERDCYILRWWPIHWLFQLTRSRGAWPQGVFKQITTGFDFNSHAHVERDEIQSCSAVCSCVFQLTRSRGAWLQSVRRSFVIDVFQLTRSRGAWQVVLLPREQQ